MADELRVDYADNRGDETVRYGFVYFTDGKRVTYVGTEVRDGTGGWEPITDEHKRLASEFLSK